MPKSSQSSCGVEYVLAFGSLVSFFALFDGSKEFLGRRPDMTFGDFAENFLFKHAQKKAKIHQKRQFAVERGVFSIKCVEYVEFVRWCRTNYRKWAFPHIYVRSGYILGAIACAYACRLPPRTKPRNASLVPKGSLSLTRMIR